MSSKYLLAVSIGPVQDFIASARKTSDLWFGSWLLSELSKAAALEIITNEKNTDEEYGLIFPSGLEADFRPESDYSVSNKLYAIVSNPNSFDIDGAVKRRFCEIIDESLNHSDDIKVNAILQVKDLLEIYHVSVPYQTYGKSKSDAESVIAARKNTKDFVPVTWGNSQPKSSITGDAESITHDFNDSMKRRFAIKGGEELSGIDLIKRGGGITFGQSKVPSTSEIASSSFHKFVSSGYPEIWNKFSGTMKECGADLFHDHIDGSFLYESRINSEIEDASQKEASVTLRKFFDDLKDAGFSKHPEIYYSILRADGDGIGSFIDSISKNENSVAVNRSFSKALSLFSAKAGELVRSCNGYPVYTGGDDVLAFLPIDKAIYCSEKLSELFHNTLEEGLKGMIPADQLPTMSAGIAIVHHLSSLDDSLKLSAKAESEAKSVDGKNALCVILSKRGGSDIAIKGKFSVPSEKSGIESLPDQISESVKLFKNENVSYGLPYELRELKTELFGLDRQSENKGSVYEILKLEIERILKQKNLGSDILDNMNPMIDEMSSEGIDNYINLLILARFFASEVGDYSNLDGE